MRSNIVFFLAPKSRGTLQVASSRCERAARSVLALARRSRPHCTVKGAHPASDSAIVRTPTSRHAALFHSRGGYPIVRFISAPRTRLKGGSPSPRRLRPSPASRGPAARPPAGPRLRLPQPHGHEGVSPRGFRPTPRGLRVRSRPPGTVSGHGKSGPGDGRSARSRFPPRFPAAPSSLAVLRGAGAALPIPGLGAGPRPSRSDPTGLRGRATAQAAVTGRCLPGKGRGKAKRSREPPPRLGEEGGVAPGAR